MAALDAPNANRYLDRAKSLLLGVTGYLMANGRFLPWREQDGQGAPGGDVPDYSTGVGVVMRGLLDVYTNNTTLRDFMNSANYPKLVANYANFVVDNPDDQYGVVGPANDVATLTLATAMGF